MKRFLLVAILFTVSFSCLINDLKAQQDPQYTQYMFNRLNYNPAFAGNNPDYVCAGFMNRLQWLGFAGPEGENAPNTQAFNIHTPIRSKIIQGAGLNVWRDAQGFEQTFSFQAAAAYKKQFTFGRLSAGVSLGGTQKSLNGDWRYIEPNDPIINKLANGTVSNLILDVGLGLYFQAEKFFVGVSGLHLNEGNLEWGPDSRYKQHFYLTGGYIFDISPNFSIRPSTLVKYDGVKMIFDINAMAVYQDKYWAGLTYRESDAFAINLGLKITDQLKLGYAYDLPYNGGDIKQIGSHEVFIGYCFKLDPKIEVEDDGIPIWTPRYM